MVSVSAKKYLKKFHACVPLNYEHETVGSGVLMGVPVPDNPDV
jgi:hypothetical protein